MRMLYARSSKAFPVDLLTNGLRSNNLPVAPLRSHVVAVFFDVCVVAGIVVYKEVTGVGKIASFLGSGCVVVAGAVLLGSYGSCTAHHAK